MQARKALAVTATALAFLFGGEALRTTPYRDVAGVLTVCIGETHGVRENDRYTEQQCWDMARSRLESVATAVSPAVARQPGPHQNDAILSFCYNVGNAGCKGSTFLLLHNAGQCYAAADALLMWDKITVNGQKVTSRGLHNRRLAERALYLKDCK